ncbi:MAG: hypothetical protein JXA54_01300 [Candidatus Heimdallarchaeota archaeon]|nr:hypothetical protein [Candidatus Heimdallarchaeota archaeon]
MTKSIFNTKIKRKFSQSLTFIFCILIFNTSNLDIFPSQQSQAETIDTFPFVDQYMTYEVTQTTGSLIASSGTLTVRYLYMINESAIFGTFHVDVISLIEVYNETAVGSENLNTRHLYIDADNTYIIYIFMVYFFEWLDGISTPTPMWIFPHDLHVNHTTRFWNYTATCLKSQSISIMDRYYEVFVYRTYGSYLNMTLMYGLARNGNSEWYGLLFYMSGSFFEPVTLRKMNAYFKLSKTNAELFPLDEINSRNILTVTISFYSTIIVGSIVYRVKKRKDLIGGEI